MRLSLEFMPRRPSRLRWVPAGVMLVFSTLLVDRYISEMQALDQVVSDLSALHAQVRRNDQLREKAAQPDPRTLRDSDAVQSVAQKLRYPWSEVLSTIEGADTPDVAMLTYTHSASDQGSEIIVEAREPEAINDYVMRLNQTGEIRQWYVASFQPELATTPPTVKARIRYIASKH